MILNSPFLLALMPLFLLSPPTTIADEGRDSDCDPKTGKCGWTFQDAFCYHATSRFKDRPDKRYRIHSFAIVHGQLYIFAAMAFFRVPLGHPPFHVSHGIQLLDLSNELPNNMYRNYRTVGYNYATLGLELDEDWEAFFVGANLQDIIGCCSQIWHTTQVIRNRRLEYQPVPGTYPYAFNVFFGDTPTVQGTNVYRLDRIISGTREFWHLQLAPNADNVTTSIRIWHYAQKAESLAFDIKEYYLSPVNGTANDTAWYLETADLASKRSIQRSVSGFAQYLLKNGYIYQDRMYLSRLDWLEVYDLTYPNGAQHRDRIKLTYVSDIKCQDVITCTMLDKDNHQFWFTVQLGLFFAFAIVVTSLLVVAHKSSIKGLRFVVGPNSMLFEINEGTLANTKKQK